MMSFESAAQKITKDDYAKGVGIPWWLKAFLKLSLSLLPLPYTFWSYLKIFRHSDYHMDPNKIQNVFQKHISYFRENISSLPKVIMQLGPGDTLAHCISGYELGVNKTIFLDVGNFAEKNIDHYKMFVNHLGLDLKFDTLGDLLEKTNSNYFTDGITSLRKIKSKTVDFSFSHAVLEHVDKNEFREMMQELYRVHKRSSFSSHWVDLHDHLGGGLNNLRFPESFWNSKIIKRSGFYTNRLRMKQIINLAEEAGFKAEVKEIYSWNKLPTPKTSLNRIFKGYSCKELKVCTFLIFLRKVS